MPPKEKKLQPHRWKLDADGLFAVKPVQGWCDQGRTPAPNDEIPHECLECQSCGAVHCVACGRGIPYSSHC